MWQVINGTVDQVYLSPFPVTADSGILVRFPVAGQLKEHTDRWDASVTERNVVNNL